MIPFRVAQFQPTSFVRTENAAENKVNFTKINCGIEGTISNSLVSDILETSSHWKRYINVTQTLITAR